MTPFRVIRVVVTCNPSSSCWHRGLPFRTAVVLAPYRDILESSITVHVVDSCVQLPHTTPPSDCVPSFLAKMHAGGPGMSAIGSPTPTLTLGYRHRPAIPPKILAGSAFDP